MFLDATYLSILLIFIFISISWIIIHYHSIQQFKLNDPMEVDLIQNFFNFNLEKNQRNTAKNVQYIPKYMLELYKNAENHFGPEIVKSVLPKEFESARNVFDSFRAENHLLIFNLPEENPREVFLHAELRIFTMIQSSSEARGVERIVHIGHINESSKLIEIHGKRHFYHFNNTWLSFNVSTLIESLLSQKSKALKLLIGVQSLENCSDRFELVLEPNSVGDEYPLLILSYQSRAGGVKRYKRNVDAEDYEEETNQVWNVDSDMNGVSKTFLKRIRRLKNTCKRKPLYVDFAEINFDSWIVQPEGYEAYQCNGKCFYPVAEHLTPTKHAIIQALMHSSAPQRYARVCCVPTRLGPISVLYVDSKGTLTYRYNYQDMVVLECGCR